MLRTPKGWTGPKQVDGVPVEGTFRAHQVPLPGVRENPAHLAQLEESLARSAQRDDITLVMLERHEAPAILKFPLGRGAKDV